MAHGNHEARPSVSPSTRGEARNPSFGTPGRGPIDAVSHGAGPAGPGTRAAVGAYWFWPGLLIVMVVGLLVRGEALGAKALTPVEQVHVEAAGLRGLESSGSPFDWLADDASWARRTLRRPVGDAPPAPATPVLHGVAARLGTRVGLKAGIDIAAALRLLSLAFGAGCIFVVALLLRSVSPNEPLVALTGAAFTAVQLGAVTASRTGTGEHVAAFFLLVMIYGAWRLYGEVGERHTAALLAYGTLIAVSSCLALGFDPSARDYGAILAGAGVLLFRTGPNGVSNWPWYSRRTWTVLVALAPMAALVWLGLGDGEPRRVAIGPMLHARLASWPVLILLPLGLAGAFTRDIRWLIWLVLWAFVPALLGAAGPFRWTPSYAHYLAIDMVCIALAAEGAGVLWGLARHRVSGAFADAAAAGAVLWMSIVTWATVHGVGPARLLVELP